MKKLILITIATFTYLISLAQDPEVYLCVKNQYKFNAFYLEGVGMITALHNVYEDLKYESNVIIYYSTNDKKNPVASKNVRIIKAFPEYDLAVLGVDDIYLKSIKLKTINTAERSTDEGYSFYKINSKNVVSEAYGPFKLNIRKLESIINLEDVNDLKFKNFLLHRNSNIQNSQLFKYDFKSYKGLSGCPIVVQIQNGSVKSYECVGMHLGSNYHPDDDKKFRFGVAFTSDVINKIKSTAPNKIEYEWVNAIWNLDQAYLEKNKEVKNIFFQNDIMTDYTQYKGQKNPKNDYDSILNDIIINYPTPKLTLLKYDKILDFIFWPSAGKKEKKAKKYFELREEMAEKCPCTWNFSKLYFFEYHYRNDTNINPKIHRDVGGIDFKKNYEETLSKCESCAINGVPKLNSNNKLNENCMTPQIDLKLSELLTAINNRKTFDSTLASVILNIDTTTNYIKLYEPVYNAMVRYQSYNRGYHLTVLLDSVKRSICRQYSDSLSVHEDLLTLTDTLKRTLFLSEARKFCEDEIYAELSEEYSLPEPPPKPVPDPKNTYENLSLIVEKLTNEMIKAFHQSSSVPEYSIDKTLDTICKVKITYGQGSGSSLQFGHSYWNFPPGKYKYLQGDIMNDKIENFILALIDSLKKNSFIDENYNLSLGFEGMADGIPFRNPFQPNERDFYPKIPIENPLPQIKRSDDDYYNKYLAFARGSYLASELTTFLQNKGIEVDNVSLKATTTPKKDDYGRFRKVSVELSFPVSIADETK
jgi:hypothetical protein